MNFSKQTDNFPETFYAFIEIPQGSGIKYEYKEDLEAVVVDRFLFTSMTYPTNYGFALGTKGKDGDPLDVLVMSQVPISSGMVIKVRPIGIAVMSDEEGSDNKVIAVPVEKVDPAFSSYKDAQDIPEFMKNKIKHFFEHYKELEKGKFMKFEKFESREEAMKELKESRV
ncbi:Inorganic pyrophosphatase [Candidatus Micrarchaeum sp.]|uniref:Inorganic pyrophosphatase n=1 Tax=uncultured euryarchaeote ARMAN-1 TaxID=425594 RepID=Q6DNH4_9EURY|nr:inorganic diphosphatase [Candidatus Micrarchaeum sp.]AAT68184.1 inorganic pyrophosphate [uncultured euryarchaeote ARMAN-1]OJI07428.1 MAG: inorganic pyrophosphatase [Candidatus Micrarchaeum sp. ARMAN-1]OJT94312.1 MAG: inorganic pyrophosphatase [Candidatus Micrarchaeum sp. AZ1]OWP53513.1 MAG: inorganic pyrophosphatase [Thermoplasmatales archaeon ARMAN]QRF73710.1 Inorganic pyrophosphatase [Candidatus Micrarchaeum sp.]